MGTRAYSQRKGVPLGSFGERHKELDPAKETIEICRSGNRSALAGEPLAPIGYKVVNMKGSTTDWSGMIVHWEATGDSWG